MRPPPPDKPRWGLRHLCPVCYRPVVRTQHHRICGHMNPVNEPCEGSFEPFYITLAEYTEWTKEAG